MASVVAAGRVSVCACARVCVYVRLKRERTSVCVCVRASERESACVRICSQCVCLHVYDRVLPEK